MDDKFQKDLMAAVEAFHNKKFLIQKKEDEISMIKRQIEEKKKANEELVKRSYDAKLLIEKETALYTCQRLNKEKMEKSISSVMGKVDSAVTKSNHWDAKMEQLKQFYKEKIDLIDQMGHEFSFKCGEKIPVVRALLDAKEKVATLENMLLANQELREAERKKMQKNVDIEAEDYEAFKKKCISIGEELATLNKITKSTKMTTGSLSKPTLNTGKPGSITVLPVIEKVKEQKQMKPGRRDFRAQLKALNEAAQSVRIQSQQRPAVVPRRDIRIIRNISKDKTETPARTLTTNEIPSSTPTVADSHLQINFGGDNTMSNMYGQFGEATGINTPACTLPTNEIPSSTPTVADSDLQLDLGGDNTMSNMFGQLEATNIDTPACTLPINEIPSTLTVGESSLQLDFGGDNTMSNLFEQFGEATGIENQSQSSGGFVFGFHQNTSTDTETNSSSNFLF